ncbi:MAG TPA: LON peptidase substrate-binding domain-containing protein [Blastocatellia bacterium]|nr:LON peptidase substrate-binding domain-containing protein [Blastocatellia bacterium]
MPTRVIPIFPLALVQFPGALTPLHIFEPRYRQLLRDVQAADQIFGITCRPEDPDTGADAPPPGSVGCTVEVIAAQELPDGRSNILCVGGTRYRTRNYLEGEPYLRAEIEIFEDDPAEEDPGPQAERAAGLFRRVLAASKKLKEAGEEAEAPELPAEAQALSFIIAASLDIELGEKQELLELTSTAERLRRVNELLADLATAYERRAQIHGLSRSNGHGGALPL